MGQLSDVLGLAQSLILLTSVAPMSALQVQVTPCLCFGYDTIYKHSALEIWKTSNISLSQYQGKLVLIVNVDTYSEYTSQYWGLNELQARFPYDLVVLGFPCKQFRNQEPGANATEILNGLAYVRPGSGFVPIFQMFATTDVNGDKEHPLFTYLKSCCPPTRDEFARKEDLWYEPLKNHDVRWGWEKFLIDRWGRPISRYDSTIPPFAIANDIQNLIYYYRYINGCPLDIQYDILS